ncbi:HSP20-like chaperone [Boletus edulis BED1]|uniref:HSP20-like chaperone n=1 Tax=Boletus edulis BED1 TaxID=1328754 RepID=A0AAD4G608_BOLED|nr:HSP20-like chaperone [Boletus edulis BED1]
MSVMRFYYDPFSEFDRLFDDAFSFALLALHRVDVHEDAENNTVTASFELPGLKPEEVNIDVSHDRLTVSGETSTSQQRDERGFTVRERSWGKFTRTLMLPQGTKPEEVKAKMEHGLLNVTFPKAQPMQEPKRIAIHSE